MKLKGMVLSVLVALGASQAQAGEEWPMTNKGDRNVGAQFATRSQVIARHGMAATSIPLVTQVALDVLKKGGNAVDAAIAANAAIGLMEPTGNGIGGDLFAIIWDPKTKKLYGLNAAGRSPMGLSYDQMVAELKKRGRDSIPPFGALPVSVPGTVDGWFMMHEKFGTMEMTDILAPAISYAREGFPVTQLIAYYMSVAPKRYLDPDSGVEETENYQKTYLPGGRPPVEGQIFRNPDLANTLEKIAKGGRDVFYKGEIAEVIDSYMKRIGGYLRKEDLATHHGRWIEPVSINYRGYDVFELPPQGQGIAALQQLNILEGYDLKSLGHNSADYLHLHVEAKKLAFEDRARFYADPDFYKVPIEKLLSKDYAAGQRKLISMDKAVKEVAYPDPDVLQEGDTIYLTVADKDGMMVSLIQSNYRGMGSGLVPDGLGFMFQDRGELFTLKKGHPNVYAPGKRPFHTIIPAFIMKDGKPFMSFGLMGGGMQPQGHAQIVTNIIDFGMNVQEAGDAARYRHDGSSQPTGEIMRDGGVLHVESGITPEVVEQLRKKGHTVVVGKGGYGGYQAIMLDEAQGVYKGASEMRKDGQAAGY
ncbi:gamma-glutamyltransferase [Emcibacter nanhaiensis]|uniref:Glutathione hydrolase proenzyme n=2 Tax=Emcibacter nanhaiensis TaxID=1505037 RepID=A0A501PNU5_9PROT|nr:gamma-glutamyltransferase [Emcibacter nanhaiensis]TPD61935.1 gamma-glutamyltransferase [Emcibacter nanhaiensis]